MGQGVFIPSKVSTIISRNCNMSFDPIKSELQHDLGPHERRAGLTVMIYMYVQAGGEDNGSSEGEGLGLRPRARHEPNLLQRLPIFLSSSPEIGCFLTLPIFLVLCDTCAFPLAVDWPLIFCFPASSECFGYVSREFTHEVTATATATASSITVAGTSCTQTGRHVHLDSSLALAYSCLALYPGPSHKVGRGWGTRLNRATWSLIHALRVTD